MFFVQMSGFPGSGKSTLSRLIGKVTGAVIIDHDIVKSSLLNSIEANSIDAKLAGKITYNIDWSLIEFHLSQGHNVIFDSPCLYQEMVDRGIGLAEKYNMKYKYVECYLNNFHEINNRLKSRERMISQIQEVKSEETFNYTIANSKKPIQHPYIVVDSGRPIESYIDEVIKYIND
ncbi:AAA family ATPase [Ureibacillus manganicus]|uniref:ATP-binding protein n=1 Tax=Ureibacillus manganicus DSM 26584 TaxID=1384049 RepID=A0A0A3I2H6_9BACL|nr:AAA family ATPase [Ureibacillus manganicus]KGR77705.1 ATP-binding protein [Ureibacillus manganicus DSM 26584]